MRGLGRPTKRGTQLRAQSSMIATVLLVGMVVTSATIVVFAGSGAINRGHEEAEYANARNAMESVGATLNGVSNEGGESTVDLSTFEGGDVSLNESAGRLFIEVADNKTGGAQETNTSVITLGRLVYEQGERTVAYQNGGVFESTGEGSNVVSRPPVSYQVETGPATLTFPVIRVTGATTKGQLRANRTSVGRLFETENVDLDPDTDRIDTEVLRKNYTLNLTVSSEYYRAWGEVFSDRLNLTTYYDHSANNVTISLTGNYEEGSTTMSCIANCGGGTGSGPDFGLVNSAVFSDTAATSITDQTVSNSYNSTVNPYPAGLNDRGDVRVNGSVRLQNHQEFGGDLHATEGLDASTDQPVIKGDAVFGEHPDTVRLNTGRLDVGGNMSMNNTFDNSYGARVDIGSDSDNHYLYVGNDAEFDDVDVEGDVYVDGNVDATYPHATDIEGDLIVDGDVTLDSGDDVDGDIHATGTVTTNGASVGGVVDDTDPVAGDIEHGSELEDMWIEPRVPVLNAANDLIDDRASTYAGNTDNGGSPAPAPGNDWTVSGNTYTLGTGNYTLGKLTVGGGRGNPGVLRLDPSSGPINIHLDRIRTRQHGSIQVVPHSDANKRVNFYVEDQIRLTDQSEIMTVGNTTNATEIWAYLKNTSSFDMSSSGNTQFTGVVYGAGGPDGTGADISVGNNAMVFGALIGSLDDLNSQAGIHYDLALSGRGLAPGGGGTGLDAVYRPVYDDSVTASDYNEVVYFESTNRTVAVG